MTQITYIWHDCFVVELPELIMVFDFWKDPVSPHNKMPEFIKNADKNKTLCVFVSHHHKDHFSKRIFEWESLFKRVVFILSEDAAKHIRHILNTNSLYKGIKPSGKNCVILSPGQQYCDAQIKIEAFGSTDIGNSYYIEVAELSAEKKSFFHAGDLNAWLWADESTQEEVAEALNNYKEILQSLSATHPKINYVMFPVDSRIGTGYATGARLFVRAIDVDHFFPMHFGLGESNEELQKRRLDAADVKLYANPDRGDYICLQAPYSTYLEG
ncbi:MAG: hypothetical protein K2J78_02560 [Muribaculaceae bacterium]|nr:hypothetical protein [Muribaculaceae bacterium]